jgi:hypothetical protein
VTIVISYWGAIPHFDKFADVLIDICRRNHAVLPLYDGIPGFQDDPLLRDFREKIKKVSIPIVISHAFIRSSCSVANMQSKLSVFLWKSRSQSVLLFHTQTETHPLSDHIASEANFSALGSPKAVERQGNLPR